MHDHQGFESFRRERNKRRMEGGPLRPLGQNAAILRELEEAEARDVMNQRLTREVHEFFADATRTAAGIVSQVAENAEQVMQQAVTREMAEFLAETIRRAQQFVELMSPAERAGLAQQDLETNMQNLVGRALDEFRFAGDPATAEAHVGQDPFATDLVVPDRSEAPIDVGPGPQAAQPTQDAPGPSPSAAAAQEDPSPIEEHLVAELLGHPEEELSTDDGSPLARWCARLARDDDAMRTALRALVKVGVMSKDEARAIYAGR